MPTFKIKERKTTEKSNMPSVMDNKIKILGEREKEAQREKSMAHKGRYTSSFEVS